ncbi:hypothetical protein [Xanthomonas virus PB119]|nr:hypothetical protein [Xanthomonas virus PB119]
MLTENNGNKVIINKDCIVMVQPGKFTVIQTTMDGYIYASEPFDEVLSLLND